MFPAAGKNPKPSDFFTQTPKRQTALAVIGATANGCSAGGSANMRRYVRSDEGGKRPKVAVDKLRYPQSYGQGFLDRICSGYWLLF